MSKWNCPIPKRTSARSPKMRLQDLNLRPRNQMGKLEKKKILERPYVHSNNNGSCHQSIWIGDEHPWAPATLKNRVPRPWPRFLAIWQVQEMSCRSWCKAQEASEFRLGFFKGKIFQSDPSYVQWYFATRWPSHILGGEDIVIDVCLVCVRSFLLDRFHTCSWKKGRSFWPDSVVATPRKFGLNLYLINSPGISWHSGLRRIFLIDPLILSDRNPVATQRVAAAVAAEPLGVEISVLFTLLHLRFEHRKPCRILNGIQ